MGQLMKVAALVGMAMAATACGDEDEPPGLEAIDTPMFEDGGEGDEGAVTTSTVGPGDPIEPGPDEPGGASGTVAVGDNEPTATPTTAAPGDGSPRRESVSFDDPVGDATPGVGTSTPPPWSDLAGASLERQGNAYRLIVRLGGEAPRSTSGGETMNVATFFDTDGDGAVEHELWVNVGPEGWGPVFYDDQGHAAPGEASNVTVVVEGSEVRMLFPDVMLGAPERLRFSLASEYGELAQIGSSFARRDDAPDGDRSVAFPA